MARPPACGNDRGQLHVQDGSSGGMIWVPRIYWAKWASRWRPRPQERLGLAGRAWGGVARGQCWCPQGHRCWRNRQLKRVHKEDLKRMVRRMGGEQGVCVTPFQDDSNRSPENVIFRCGQYVFQGSLEEELLEQQSSFQQALPLFYILT